MKLIHLPPTSGGRDIWVNPDRITHVQEYQYLGETHVGVGLEIAHGGSGHGEMVDFQMSAAEFIRHITEAQKP